MEPQIGHSVARTSPHACRWVIGTLMVCEETDGPESVPADAVAQWQDGDITLYLRKRLSDELLEGDFAADRVHVGGTSAAVWCLGENTFCKAHAWIEGLELEANNLRFVAEKMPDVTIPGVIYSWIDREISRTFLLTKRVQGQILDNVWPRLSTLQRTEIADYIARVCVTLAANTSSRLETITGCGIYEPYLLENATKIPPDVEAETPWAVSVTGGPARLYGQGLVPVLSCHRSDISLLSRRPRAYEYHGIGGRPRHWHH